MSRLSRFLLGSCALLAFASPVLAASPAKNSARMAIYNDAKGDAYFALSVSPNVAVVPAKSHDVLVLFDTSASQTGLYRDDAMSSLRSLLATLDHDDRVHVMAVDLNAVAMTQGFVAPDSEAMQTGIAKLQRRSPLGSTDMMEALQTAAKSFQGNRSRSVVYIGDGISRANLLETAEMSDMMRTLVRNRIPVSSFAIGPQRDMHLLAAIANHTGGMMFVDSNQKKSAQQAGAWLAQASQATVVWPTHARLPKSIVEVYPSQFPPLRVDRDTVVIGRVDGKGDQRIDMTAEANGRPLELTWNVSVPAPSNDMGFLPQMVSMVRADQGLRLPTVGSVGLREAGRLMTESAERLARLGNQALQNGDLASANVAARAALRSDPGNPHAQAIGQATNRKMQGRQGTTIDAELRLVNMQDQPAPNQPQNGSLLTQFSQQEGRFLDSVRETQRVQEELIETQVEIGLEESRTRMSEDAAGARESLKLLSEQIKRAPELNPDVRAQLLGKIESGIREAGRQAIVQAEQRAQVEAREAMKRDERRILAEASRGRDRIKQLMARFNALMDERRYHEAANEVAPEVLNLAPKSPTAMAAFVSSHFTLNVRELERVRRLRHKNFVEALLQVEKALIPFSDEPPIVYPSPEVWEELTLARKKYASIDLARTGGAEQKIFEALDEDTRIEFIEAPLQDVVTFLEDQHDIEIELDVNALADVAIDPETPVTKNLKGISLRSALRLMLKDLELTYVVKNEVLLITTPEQAESELLTKVYPVGDLVLPITSGASPLGGFGGGGGGNGFGGGGGGGGFGGGGIGGGGFGGGGRGGGIFDVEDALTLGAKKNNAATAKVTQPATKTAKTRQVEIIKLPATPGVDKHEAWNQYFADFDTKYRKLSIADQRTHTLRVRETVRDMLRRAGVYVRREQPEAAKPLFEEIVSLLLAAIHHGHPQAWMYEAMGLAMQANGAPQEELERVVMSAVDLNSNPDAIMHAASYMARIGLDKRALKLYREISSVNPLRPEPYLNGLVAAQKLEDVEGIKWATLGILQQAWPKEHQRVAVKARHIAEATLEKLKTEKRTEEALRFEQDLQKALVRDCVVVVSWTGDADIDLMVEEPSGTVCSYRNPISAGGGVLMGDSFSHKDGASSVDGFAESYCCPQGFNGNYRVLIQKVWGKITAGKVTVDVYLNQGLDNEKHFRKQMEVGEKDALLTFGLDSGRRNQPLEEEQVALAARAQVENVAFANRAVNRAILAQQLNGLENSVAVREFARQRRQGAADGRFNPNFFRRGAVGFQPVIERFPEGTNLGATAVISADRRYVRISIPSVPPIFSGVGDVATFNIATGAQGGQTGGNPAANVGGGPGGAVGQPGGGGIF